jgi:hypothetical protein
LSDRASIRAEAQKQWDQARRKALWSKMRSYVTRADDRLIDFEEISTRLGLRNTRYRGLQEVELGKIVGSVGRYHDFTRSFLPVTRKMERRWENVAGTFISSVGTGPPPVELYKVGDSYFVKDGNHRCSVARQLGMVSIEAYVWEYQVPGNREDANIDALIMEAERADFLECTRLDSLRPDHGIVVTEPGGYRDLIHQIAGYRDVLQKIDEEEKSHHEAVTGWFDLRYEPIVQIINRERVLENFPERTAADLYIWANRHHAHLEDRYGRRIRYTTAIKSLDVSQSNPLKRMLNRIRGFLPFITV